MKGAKRIKAVLICLLSAMLLFGCGGGKTTSPAPETAAVTAQAVTEAQTAEKEKTAAEKAASEEQKTISETENLTETKSVEEVPEVDRYEEIMDRSGDESKLSFYCWDIRVGEDADDKAGDSTLFISPDGKTMLLDAGHPDCADQVIGYLKDLGITRIDYFVASHPHIDHIGSFPKIAETFEIGKAYRSEVEYTTQTYQNYVDALKAHEIPVEYLKAGDTFSFGDQITVKIYNPGEEIVYPKDFPKNSTAFMNNQSLAMKFLYGESTVLFCGDLYSAAERDLVEQYGEELQADVVKANHHGRDTSNTKKWIETVKPKIAVAMLDQAVNMPVRSKYNKADSEFYMTFYDGIIKVVMDDKKNYEVVSQHDSWLHEEEQSK
ncbi:MBL fold metallo-hydrolase [Clostridium sp. MCC353]|uniref:ComEC/Rec2 family competence protein n=1 Tax=Clostridium sp. MCC353 TaxID=2592646 RepID=UPI001C01000E|nr:MBL fold metallo-hydrolase [Clostridium sp. MCC353]MBT9778095.1 MBL fold metallo-hydrolase [Clostridium sp. MCC353]